MAFYAVVLQDRIIQRVTERHGGADNTRYFLVEAGSRKMTWLKAIRAADAGGGGSANCESCGHRYCKTCDDGSLSQRSSDYWICHSCSALCRWLPSLH